MPRSAAKGLAAIALVLLIIACIGLALAALWYQDDACNGVEWKCDAGGWGLAAMVFGGGAAVVFALLASVVWIIQSQRGEVEHEPSRASPMTLVVGTAAVLALAYFAAVWLDLLG